MSEIENIKPPLIITNAWFAGDGGSIGFETQDSNSDKYRINLPQYLIKENFVAERIPGRLHLNDHALGLRSEEESTLIRYLEESRIRIEYENPDKTSFPVKDLIELTETSSKLEDRAKDLANTLYNVINFVQSDDYIAVAQQIKN